MLRDTAASCSTAESPEKEYTCLARRCSASEVEGCLLPLKGRTLQRCRALRRAVKRCTAEGGPKTGCHHGSPTKLRV